MPKKKRTFLYEFTESAERGGRHNIVEVDEVMTHDLDTGKITFRCRGRVVQEINIKDIEDAKIDLIDTGEPVTLTALSKALFRAVNRKASAIPLHVARYQNQGCN